MPSWWGWQTATRSIVPPSHLPRLLYERLDEMGIDFSILYPSTTLGLLDIDDPELAARWPGPSIGGWPSCSSPTPTA
jgi:hypothetical protein